MERKNVTFFDPRGNDRGDLCGAHGGISAV